MDSCEIEILKVERSDLETILEVQRLAFASEAEQYGNWDIEPLHQSIESIREDYEKYIFLKAVAGDRIVGSVKVRVEDGQAHIGKLIVLPEFRRRGIGRRLLTAAHESVNADKYVLFTGSKSEGNIRLYESCGYRITGQRPDPKSADMILVVMEKKA